jgi:hypothetical protein
MQQTRLARFPAADLQIKRIAKRTSTRSEPISTRTIRGQLMPIEPIEVKSVEKIILLCVILVAIVIASKIPTSPLLVKAG